MVLGQCSIDYGFVGSWGFKQDLRSLLVIGSRSLIATQSCAGKVDARYKC